MYISFWPAFIGLEIFVLLQIPFAWRDRYLFRSQRAYYFKGFTLCEHGGWWIDLLVVSPVFAWVASNNAVRYWSPVSFLLAAISAFAWIYLCRVYSEQAKTSPEAHTHGGRTTFAGYVHAIFAIISSWFASLYFFGGFETLPTGAQRLVMSLALWTIAVIGGVKFSRQWKWTKSTTIQSIGVALVLMVGEVHMVGLL
jgi:hypothetical protein